MTRKILFDTIWRQAVLVVVAALLVWFAVRFALRPLMQLRSDVASRAPTDLSDFDPDRVHKEMRPLVLAMNGYMERLQTLITGQRRFIADASHQLRTPLTVLKTQAELALREFDRNPHDPRSLRELVHSIAGTTDATVHLANRLLTLARAEHGAAEGGMTPVALADAARQVALELAQNAVARHIDLSFEADEEVFIDGSALLLHELVVNLLDNAIRYTPGGGRVALRVFGQMIGDDLHAVLEVSDSGPGVPAQDRERVFAPFYRAPLAQLANPHGAGLGMSIVRDIASAHRGEISLSDGVDEQGKPQGLVVTARFAASASR